MDRPIKKIRCLIVDDEPLAREVINRFITRVPSLELIAECDNALQALTVVQQQEIDLVFVDIQMPELLGTEFIRILQHPPKFILTTAFPEYALEGYDLDVVDYLLKPIQFERFLKAINKAAGQIGITAPAAPAPQSRQQEKADPYLYFRTDRKMIKVMLDDIIYIEGMKNYIRIITTHGTIITKNSMAAVEAMLPEAGFIRTHRSFIVSRTRVRSFTGETVGLGSIEIPIGKLFKNSVMKALTA
jgi:DNA-binding LytR/AlgR family response regulator